MRFPVFLLAAIAVVPVRILSQDSAQVALPDFPDSTLTVSSIIIGGNESDERFHHRTRNVA